MAVVAALASAPIAFFQAHLFAWLANRMWHGRRNTIEVTAPNAFLMRRNWVFFVPFLIVAAFDEEERTYTWPEPQAILMTLAVPALFIGVARVSRDAVERRYGYSEKRLRRAYIYAAIMSVSCGAFVGYFFARNPSA